MSYPVLIIPEGVESSDGRSYNAGVLSWRETIPLMFTDETTDGHGGAFQVGVITNVRRQTFEGQTWIIGDLSYDIDAEAAEAERLAVENQIPGVSADVAAIFEETGELDEMGLPVFVMVSAEIVGATQIPMPAFGDARILTETQVPVLVAALPPEVKLDWFKDPQLDGPTRLTVDGGRVYGHLATWGECHTGYANVCKTPPKGTDYRYFHTGTLEVEGEKIEVGKITMDTGHAPLTFSATEARQAHYDNTGTCAADVCAGEDEYGIWVAGAVEGRGRRSNPDGVPPLRGLAENRREHGTARCARGEHSRLRPTTDSKRPRSTGSRSPWSLRGSSKTKRARPAGRTDGTG